MTHRRLPIGIQTSRKIRDDDCRFVDKIAFALRLIAHGQRSRWVERSETTPRHSSAALGSQARQGTGEIDQSASTSRST